MADPLPPPTLVAFGWPRRAGCFVLPERCTCPPERRLLVQHRDDPEIMDDSLPPEHVCPSLAALVLEHGLKEDLQMVAEWERDGREQRRTAIFGPGCTEDDGGTLQAYQEDAIPEEVTELGEAFPVAEEMFLTALRLIYVDRGARALHRGWIRKYYKDTWSLLAKAKAHRDARVIAMESYDKQPFAGYEVHISPTYQNHFNRFHSPPEPAPEQDPMEVDREGFVFMYNTQTRSE